MTRPNPKDDWEFIKSEIKLGLNFLKDYFTGKANKSKKVRIGKILDFGPWKGLGVLFAVLVSGYVWYQLSYLGDGNHWIISLFVFLLICDLVLHEEKERVIWPKVVNFFKWIFGIIAGIFSSIGGWFDGLFGGSSSGGGKSGDSGKSDIKK